MAKINWLTHCLDFLSQSDTSAQARRAYALEHSLNENSFRRELTNHKKQLEADQESDQKTDQSRKADQKAKPDHKKQLSKKELKKQSVIDNSGSKGRKAKADQGKSDQKGGTPRASTTRTRRLSNQVVHPDGTMSFRKGNTASLIHGAYADKLFVSMEDQTLSDMPVSDMHKVMKGRFSLMEMVRTDVIRQTQIDYQDGRAHTKEVFEDGELVQVPMTFEEAIFSSMLAGLKEQTKLYDAVVKAEQTQQSLYIQLRKLSKYTHEEATDEIRKAIDLYDNGTLTAVEAGMLIEGKGIKLPVTLKGLIEREIEEMEPRNKGEEGGLTEDQLNEIRKQAIKFEGEESDKVSENQAMLAQLLSEADDGL